MHERHKVYNSVVCSEHIKKLPSNNCFYRTNDVVICRNRKWLSLVNLSFNFSFFLNPFSRRIFFLSMSRKIISHFLALSNNNYIKVWAQNVKFLITEKHVHKESMHWRFWNFNNDLELHELGCIVFNVLLIENHLHWRTVFYEITLSKMLNGLNKSQILWLKIYYWNNQSTCSGIKTMSNQE